MYEIRRLEIEHLIYSLRSTNATLAISAFSVYVVTVLEVSPTTECSSRGN